MADQVAVAVQNAFAFAETQQALNRIYEVQRHYQAQAWSAFLDRRPNSGYDRRGDHLIPLGRDPLPEAQAGLQVWTSGSEARGADLRGADLRGAEVAVVQGGRLLVPIRQGGQVVGVVGLERASSDGAPADGAPADGAPADGGPADGDDAWSAEDVDLVTSLVEQLALAAENQRLIVETRQREAAERLTREVSSRMREPVELEDVLRTAADQIRQALGSEWVEIRMTGQGDGRPPASEREHGYDDRA
jgi:GAF domain-containing protein